MLWKFNNGGKVGCNTVFSLLEFIGEGRCHGNLIMGRGIFKNGSDTLMIYWYEIACSSLKYLTEQNSICLEVER